MKDNVVQIRQIGQELACSGCGAVTHAACDCNVAYLPAGARTAKAIADPKNVGKSNVVLASELGVDPETVRRARRSATSAFAEPEYRKGQDGKQHPARREREEEDYGEDVPTPDHPVPPLARMRGFIHRARESAQMARDDDLRGLTITQEAKDAAQEAAEAWHVIFLKLNG